MSDTASTLPVRKGRVPGSKVYTNDNGVTRKSYLPDQVPAGWVAITEIKSGLLPAGNSAKPTTAPATSNGTLVPLPEQETHDIGNARFLTIYSLRGPGGMIMNGAMITGDLTDYSPDGFVNVAGSLVFIGQGNIAGVNGNRRTLIGQIETMIKAPLISEEDIAAALNREMEQELAKARAAAEARIKASLEARRKALAPASVNGTGNTIE